MLLSLCELCRRQELRQPRLLNVTPDDVLHLHDDGVRGRLQLQTLRSTRETQYLHVHKRAQSETDGSGASGFNAEDERVCERLTICVEQHEEHMRRMRVNAEEKLPTVGDSTEDSRLLLRSSSSPSGPRFSSSPRLLSVFMHRPGCVSTFFFFFYVPFIFPLIYVCTHSH